MSGPDGGAEPEARTVEAAPNGASGGERSAARGAEASAERGSAPAGASEGAGGSSTEAVAAERSVARKGLLAGAGFAPDRRLLLVLVGLAVLTRMLWVLWLHPPGDYVYSDMGKYVERAQDLAENGFRIDRTLAWQAWGTHHLLALPLWIFGADALWAGAILWGLMGASAVPAGYLLSCRVSTRAWMPKVVGLALLLWHPSLSNSGYFLSEAPFLCFQLWSTYGLVVVLQEGRHALWAGLASAVAFAVRPQSALFFVLVLLTWLVNRTRLPKVRARQLVLVALPLLAMLGYSSWRFHAHTGQWLGVAENANMNLTAGRCHNIVTQAFANERAMKASERARNFNDGRRVSIPGYRILAKSFPPAHPFALRPAMRSETIRFVGYIGDAEAHRAIRAECYRRTGTLEQLRYSVINMGLLWFVGHQWPEQSRNAKWLRPPVDVFKHVFQVLVLVPSLVGMGAAVWWIRRRPGLVFCAWQLVNSMVVAAIFFGDIRLRTPYDPYAIVLALEGWVLLALVIARWRKRRRERAASATSGGATQSPA